MVLHTDIQDMKLVPRPFLDLLSQLEASLFSLDFDGNSLNLSLGHSLLNIVDGVLGIGFFIGVVGKEHIGTFKSTLQSLSASDKQDNQSAH